MPDLARKWTQPARPALERGRLHEIHAGKEDQAAALAFALGAVQDSAPAPLFLARRMPRGAGTVPYGEGLAMLGFAPGRLVLVETRDELELLRAGLEAARCPGVGAVLLETQGAFARYDLTASRRLALAAERTRGCVIVLRLDAPTRPSAAHTRWSVAAAPSVPLAADAPGWPAIAVELLRRRDGPAGGRWRLEWDARRNTFREAENETAIPGPVVPLPAVRSGAAVPRLRSG